MAKSWFLDTILPPKWADGCVYDSDMRCPRTLECVGNALWSCRQWALELTDCSHDSWLASSVNQGKWDNLGEVSTFHWEIWGFTCFLQCVLHSVARAVFMKSEFDPHGFFASTCSLTPQSPRGKPTLCNMREKSCSLFFLVAFLPSYIPYALRCKLTNLKFLYVLYPLTCTSYFLIIKGGDGSILWSKQTDRSCHWYGRTLFSHWKIMPLT